MKVRKLRSYCINEFEIYYETNYPKKKKYFNLINYLSRKDIRLAVLAQAYYVSKNKILESNKLGEITNERFDSFIDFKNSDRRYAKEFREIMNRPLVAKKALIEIIKDNIDNTSITLYKLSYLSGISKANVYSAFNSEKYERISIRNLRQLLKVSKKLKYSTNQL